MRLRVSAARLTRHGPWDLAVLRIVILAMFLGELLVTGLVQIPILLHPTAIGSDTSNYFAAGERLNAGHFLYGPLLAGDRLVPGYPTSLPAPLLSPPLIAVIFRPLAMLPPTVAMTLWWLGGLALVIGVMLTVIARGRPRHLLGLGVVLALGLPLTFMRNGPYPYPGFDSPVSIAALTGNLNAYLFALFALFWWAAAHGRPGLSGAAAGLAAVLKLSPVFLAWWLIMQRSWRGLKAFAVTALVLALAGLVFAGVDATVQYVHLAIGNNVHPQALSALRLLNSLHAPGVIRSHATLFVVAAGIAMMAILRNRPRASFTVAILTAIYSSPVVLPGNFILLAAAAAPWAIRAPVPRRDAADPTVIEPTGMIA